MLTVDESVVVSDVETVVLCVEVTLVAIVLDAVVVIEVVCSNGAPVGDKLKQHVVPQLPYTLGM